MARSPEEQKMWRLAARYTSVGIEIAAAIGVGVVVGVWLDERWGTKPYLFLAGLALGLGTATSTIIRVVRKTDFTKL
jgi:ATP synthase protein I